MHFASAVGWTPLGAYKSGTDYNCTSTMCYGVGGKHPTFEAFQTALKAKAKALGFNGKLPSGASSVVSDGKIGADTVFLTGKVAKLMEGGGLFLLPGSPAWKEIALAVRLDLLTKEQVAALVGDLLAELTPVATVAPVGVMPQPLPSITPSRIMTFRPPAKPDSTVYQAATLPAPSSTLTPLAPIDPYTPAATGGAGNAVLIGVSVLGGLAILGGAILLTRRRSGRTATAGVGDVDGVDALRQYRDAMASPHNWSNRDLENLAHRMEIQAATRDSGEYQGRASKLRRLVAMRRAS